MSETESGIDSELREAERTEAERGAPAKNEWAGAQTVAVTVAGGPTHKHGDFTGRSPPVAFQFITLVSGREEALLLRESLPPQAGRPLAIRDTVYLLRNTARVEMVRTLPDVVDKPL